MIYTKEVLNLSSQDFMQLAHTLAIEAEVQNAYRGEADADSKDIFSGLSIIELYCLVEALSNVSTTKDAYEIMAQPTDDGKSNYYDRLIAPQHQIAYDAYSKVLARNHRHPVKVAMEVGTGTGGNLLTLLQRAQSVIANDLSPEMLKVALQKVENSVGSTQRIQAVEGNITHVHLEPGTVDFVIDNGLLPYLSPEEVEDYWKKVRTWLKRGGSYYTIDSEQSGTNWFGTTLRGRLAGMAVSAVFSNSHIVEQRRNPVPTHMAEKFGFSFQLHKYQLQPFKLGVVQWTKMGK